MTTECYFGDLPEKFKAEIERKLKRLDSPRAGGIFPSTFEDGMRYVYCQILQDIKREKEFIEAYTKLKKISFDSAHITQDLRNKHYQRHLENTGRGSGDKTTK